jgi:Raf kinase inhibitor-like YbhB/YbcL family protein
LLIATLLVMGWVAARGAFPAKLPKGNLQLTSTAFKAGDRVPAQYTCEGKNISPPLQWTNAPAETKSFVLIVDDPDAPSGNWTHWLVFDLPPSATELVEGILKSQLTPDKGKQGLNDFKVAGYGGPCPPAGKPHRYYFKLYALNAMLDLKPGAKRKEVESAMAKRIIAQAQLIAIFGKK